MERKVSYNIGVISLGCDKNRVDTEKMLYLIRNFGHKIVSDISQADILIVNTCAFLQEAREEAVDTVLNLYRESGSKPIIMTGCLPQKFIKEIFPAFIEVSAFLGTYDYENIGLAIENAAKGKRFNGVGTAKGVCYQSGRIITTPSHYAYLKISDGCNNRCTYCLIPHIRGNYRSYKEEDIVMEAEELVKGGVKELVLVAQDLTRYGKDIYGEYRLPSLLKRLSQVSGLQDNSIRLLYCYPELITRELIEEIKNNPKIIKYIDIPLQHISDGVLCRMGRRSKAESIKKLITDLRREINGISIRSTFIVGFPGETDEDFDSLCNFLREYKIDNAGFFAYSREKGTPSYSFEKQIHYKTKLNRLKRVNLIQQEIYKERNAEKADTVCEVFCDGYDEERQMYFGRTYANAPQCDRVVYFLGDNVKVGDRVLVFIETFDIYDLYGRVADKQ